MNKFEGEQLIEEMRRRHRKNTPMSVRHYRDAYYADYRHIEVARLMYPRAVVSGNVYGPEHGTLRVRKSYRGTPLVSIGKRILSHIKAATAGTKLKFKVSRGRLILEVAK